ncbi:uncharacterized protein PpBr36_11309 [Pyricularia pennisetigena]|uniref:uncharacterized protein n=1 Tax=Pyricularia pennisetigena TaxID=1578925 RepID=UPI00114DC029|nr:uncharacterized protein PpBr36_11309 [Pyricularia pennisetigena]TLS20578.1 hypothetical protein PpBr36_11309 [Pyricularia pennisetigena]
MDPRARALARLEKVAGIILKDDFHKQLNAAWIDLEEAFNQTGDIAARTLDKPPSQQAFFSSWNRIDFILWVFDNAPLSTIFSALAVNQATLFESANPRVRSRIETTSKALGTTAHALVALFHPSDALFVNPTAIEAIREAVDCHPKDQPPLTLQRIAAALQTIYVQEASLSPSRRRRKLLTFLRPALQKLNPGLWTSGDDKPPSRTDDLRGRGRGGSPRITPGHKADSERASRSPGIHENSAQGLEFGRQDSSTQDIAETELGRRADAREVEEAADSLILFSNSPELGTGKGADFGFDGSPVSDGASSPPAALSPIRSHVSDEIEFMVRDDSDSDTDNSAGSSQHSKSDHKRPQMQAMQIDGAKRRRLDAGKNDRLPDWSQYDLDRLLPGRWLNDNIINTLSAYWATGSKVGILPSWQPRSRTEKARLNLQTAYIFGSDLILLPICQDSHWLLACWTRASRELKFYDSAVTLGRVDRCVEKTKSFFDWLDPPPPLDCPKTQAHPDIQVVRGKCPQQSNSNDCGAIMLHIIYCLVQNLPIPNSLSEDQVRNFRSEYHQRLVSLVSRRDGMKKQGETPPGDLQQKEEHEDFGPDYAPTDGSGEGHDMQSLEYHELGAHGRGQGLEEVLESETDALTTSNTRFALDRIGMLAGRFRHYDDLTKLYGPGKDNDIYRIPLMQLRELEFVQAKVDISNQAARHFEVLHREAVEHAKSAVRKAAARQRQREADAEECRLLNAFLAHRLRRAAEKVDGADQQPLIDDTPVSIALGLTQEAALKAQQLQENVEIRGDKDCVNAYRRSLVLGLVWAKTAAQFEQNKAELGRIKCGLGFMDGKRNDSRKITTA